MTKNEQSPFPEREHSWHKNERVRPGEVFMLFDIGRKHTHIRYSDDSSFAGLKSSLRLETGFLGNLTMSMVAAPYAKERSAVLTPFDREQGYPLDTDDLFAQRRMAKMRHIKRERSGTLQGLSLFGYGTCDYGTDSALLQAFLPEGLDAQEQAPSRRLFLTLKFPGGASFTAQAQLNPQHTVVLFRTFFPSDTGPLPRVGNMLTPSQTLSSDAASNSGQLQEQATDRSEGFDLLVPFDLEKVLTIQAQFLFLASSR